MTEQRFDIDDPRLTAFALGELQPAEAAEVEREVKKSPELQAAVDEIRQLSDRLSEELAAEPLPSLTKSQQTAVQTAAVAAPDQPRPRRRTWAIFGVTACTLGTVALMVLALPGGRNGDSRTQFLRLPSSVLATQAEHADAARTELEESTGLAMTDFHRPAPRFDDAGGIVAGREELAPSSPQATGGVAANFNHSARISADEFDSMPIADLESRLDHNINTKFENDFGRERQGNGERASSNGPAPGSGQSGAVSRPMAQTKPTVPPSAETTQSEPAQPIRSDKKDMNKTAAPANDLNLAAESGAPDLRVGGDGQPANPAPSEAKPSDDVVQVGQDPVGVTGSEAYAPIAENAFLSPLAKPLSTFSIDVDTASYSNVRRFLAHGQWPPADAVRIEELINYFHYDYPDPADGVPFSVNLEAAACPWNPDHRLVRIGLKGEEIEREQRPPSNLVFLLDVSGSMRDQHKLPLVKQAMGKLVQNMTEDDRIAIVTYAGSAGLVLDSTSGEYKDEIQGVIDSLQAGGSTNGAAGIQLAYDTAVKHFYKGGANRVILCTDGDFNVGVSSDNELVSLITDKAKSGVFLSVFGFGMGNLKDSKLEKLADKGNGHYGYIDNQQEADKVFGEEMTGTLYTIAKDVKIQVEFNPSRVGAYRLIGYENRKMAARDFHDDTKDAGEIGAGHRVTALYEVVPPEKIKNDPNIDPLKYQPAANQPKGADTAEWLTVKLRYKLPDEDQSSLLEVPLKDPENPKAMPSPEFEWAASVAAFGMILRNSKHRGQADFTMVRELAQGNTGQDASGRRAEFLQMIQQAEAVGGRR